MQELLDKSHVLKQNYTINRNTKPDPKYYFRARQVHIIQSELGQTDKRVNAWIDSEREGIEEIVNIKYAFFPPKKTVVYIDYMRNRLLGPEERGKYPITDVKVKETTNRTELNEWLYSERDNIYVGGIRIVDRSDGGDVEKVSALIDYTEKS